MSGYLSQIRVQMLLHVSQQFFVIYSVWTPRNKLKYQPFPLFIYLFQMLIDFIDTPNVSDVSFMLCPFFLILYNLDV